MARPNIIFGGATIGMGLDDVETVSAALNLLEKSGVLYIDTAGRYPPVNPGRSEALLGEAEAAARGFTIDTKILAKAGDGSGELEEDAIKKSLTTSLQRLRVSSVNVLHCHRPDPKTPLRDQFEALDRCYKLGQFQELGVSNFSPELLNQVLAICTEHGFVKPTVYQGEYNAITRGMEASLLPMLRKHGIRFNAYRPLAAGFLTGKATSGTDQGTRFSDDHQLGKAMKGLFDKEELHTAVTHLSKSSEEAGLKLAEVALRWLFYHSALGAKDGVILGASNLPIIFEDIWTKLKGSRGSII